ncbi:hypothetical protein [Stackebrandtia endophytica]|uniref:hypothetical protein n=1 Tax=Stackebrandtia endophytica TaxID=1496996 RepID=UPI0036D29001
MGVAAGCQADDPGSAPSPSAEPTTAGEVCADTAEGVVLAEDGWSVTKTDDGEQWINYGALFDVDPQVTGVEVRVEWFDAAGEPLGWGDAAEDDSTSEILPVKLSPDGVGAVSNFVWLMGELDSLTYTVTSVCRTTEEVDPAGTVDITNTELTVDSDDEAELTMTVTSDFGDTVESGLSILFRDENGEIIGGTLATDGAVTLGEVTPGDSQHVVAFGWEDFYPAPTDIAEVSAYPNLR